MSQVQFVNGILLISAYQTIDKQCFLLEQLYEIESRSASLEGTSVRQAKEQVGRQSETVFTV